MTDWHEISGGCSRGNVMLYGKRWNPRTDEFDYAMWFDCSVYDMTCSLFDPQAWQSDNQKPGPGWRVTHWASMPEPPK